MARVHDGDTLELDDGTRVRLVGINTPEVGRDGAPNEPFAVEARQSLLRMVEKSGWRIRLRPAAERRDRYGRALAHAHSAEGINLQERLLGAGLALLYIHPPNLSNLDCYKAAEAQARSGLSGIWNDWPVTASQAHKQGFVLLLGRVKAVKQTRRSIRVELDDGPALRIARKDLGYFHALDPASLPGKSIEARGWLHSYRGRLSMRIRHPAALSILQ